MTSTVPLNSHPEAGHRSPSLRILALVFTTLFLGIAVNFIMTGGAPYPLPYIPYNPIQQIQDY